MCMLYGLVRWVSFFSVLYTHACLLYMYVHCVDTAGDDLLEFQKSVYNDPVYV